MNLDLTAAERTILDHFHPPDEHHPSWWINPGEMAKAVAPLIAAQVGEQIAAAIEADRMRRAPKYFVQTHSGDIAFGVDCGMENAAAIAREAVR